MYILSAVAGAVLTCNPLKNDERIWVVFEQLQLQNSVFLQATFLEVLATLVKHNNPVAQIQQTELDFGGRGVGLMRCHKLYS